MSYDYTCDYTPRAPMRQKAAKMLMKLYQNGQRVEFHLRFVCHTLIVPRRSIKTVASALNLLKWNPSSVFSQDVVYWRCRAG